MKQFFLFACIALVVNTQAQVKLENIVKPGTRLVYAVEAGGKKYDFIVTVKDLKGTSFSWEMTSPVNFSGTIAHSAKALAGANMMYNFFQPGDKKLDDATLSVWLSQKCFNQFEKNAGKTIKMYLHGPGNDAEDVGTFTGSVPLEITIDGKPDTVFQELVKPLSPRGVPSDDNDDFFTYYSSASFPIILRMNLDFYIALKEIRTK